MPSSNSIVTTIKLPRKTANRIASLAKKQKRSRSEVMREAIEKGLDAESKSPSMWDLASDLAGCFEGPTDLATNPKYMRGFGREKSPR